MLIVVGHHGVGWVSSSQQEEDEEEEERETEREREGSKKQALKWLSSWGREEKLREFEGVGSVTKRKKKALLN